MALALGAVARMTCAPPSFWSSAAALKAAEQSVRATVSGSGRQTSKDWGRKEAAIAST
ncbi:MAG TPA: hypothetical protein VK937_07425 [Candidatus Limnocylindria bacterium]|nr:hypothetical protein [Candidatus Limnocylindria bacterium]